ncbi:MAG: signal peptidase I [Chloroflexi bacterium]|nr:signal peptidase I [Chloroflexota bacterium]
MNQPPTSHMVTVLREVLQTILLALLIFFLVQLSLQNFKVEGSSMNPTVQSEERLLVNKLVYLRFDRERLAKYVPFISAEGTSETYPFHAPRRGEIIVFRFPLNPERNFIKRVIGLPGDVVEIRQGRVYVNGARLDEPYVKHPDTVSKAPVRVPPGQYFVLGDNRQASNDSRDWGTVPEANVIGKAWVSYWPRSVWGFVQAARYPFEQAGKALVMAFALPRPF